MILSRDLIVLHLHIFAHVAEDKDLTRPITAYRLEWRLFALIPFTLLALTSGSQPAKATDGQPILDLGIVSWLEFKKRQLVSEIKEVTIVDGKIKPTETVVSIYQAVVFHNLDKENHRLVFMPDIGNKMEEAYTSAVIRNDERWGAEFHGFGLLPFHCTAHPEERGEISVIL